MFRIFCFVFLSLATALSAQEARLADRAVERFPHGPAMDIAAAPRSAIVAWDRSELLAFMEAEIARLEAEGLPDAVLALAEDRTIYVTEDGRSGLYFVATRTAIDWAFDGPDEQLPHGLYVLLKTALDDDAWAYWHLASLYADEPSLSGSAFVDDLFRSAADRDFLPALVNTVDVMMRDPSVPPDTTEAYLRYAIDIEAEFGGWNILNFGYNFWIFEHPGRDPGDYLVRMIDRYRAFDDPQMAAQLTYLVYRDGLGVERDPERMREGAIELASYGDP